jgi:hypothetical protein
VDDSKAGVLHFDGSAYLRQGRESNHGWDPHAPRLPHPLQLLFVPEPWEGQLRGSSPSGDVVPGRHRWTRGGLLGVDFAGSEINTGQMQ